MTQRKILYISGYDPDDTSWYFPPLGITPTHTLNISALPLNEAVYEIEKIVDTDTIVIAHSLGALLLLHSDAQPKQAFFLDPSHTSDELREIMPYPLNTELKDVYAPLYDIEIYNAEDYNTNHGFESEEACKAITGNIKSLIE